MASRVCAPFPFVNADTIFPEINDYYITRLRMQTPISP